MTSIRKRAAELQIPRSTMHDHIKKDFVKICHHQIMRQRNRILGFVIEDLGKEILSLNLVLHIFSLIEKINNRSTIIIPLGYYKVHPQTISPIKQSPPLILDKTVEKMPVRQNRRKPVTKTNDFLWEI
jgi:hypothetical protein